MRTTLEFLDAIKARHSVPSDYALAKFLGVSRQAVGHYRNTRDYLGPDVAVRVAKLLDLDPAYVLICTQAERERSESARPVWQGLAARLEASTGRAIGIM
jgi:plasmid maintenance system antidote protein VapI